MKMFWGLILEPGKKYEQKAEASFHLTMAALEPSTKTPAPNKPTITSVLLESNKTSYILCNLDQQRVLQQPLDCVFTEGEPISFSVNGENKVHLTGYIMPDSDMEDSEDMFDMSGSEDSETEILAAMAEKKRKLATEGKDSSKKVKFGGDEPVAVAKADKKQDKAKQPAKAGKNEVQVKGGPKPKITDLGGADEDDEDDDDDDEDMDSEDMNDLLDNFDEDDEDEDEDDEDDDDESSPEVKKPVKPQQQKQPQQQKGTPGKPGGQIKQDNQKNQNNQQTPQKKPFQQGGQNKPWSGNKGKNQNNSFQNKNQNSGKKGTPQGNKFGGSPGNKNKKPWMQKK